MKKLIILLTIAIFLCSVAIGIDVYQMTLDRIGSGDSGVGAFADRGVIMSGTYDTMDLLSATTTTASSTKIANLSGAEAATLFFHRGDTTGQGNTGSSAFNVEVSENGTDWVIYNKLIDNVINSNSQQLTRVASTTLTGTTTEMYDMDLTTGIYKHLRCYTREITDGEATCTIIIKR